MPEILPVSLPIPVAFPDQAVAFVAFPIADVSFAPCAYTMPSTPIKRNIPPNMVNAVKILSCNIDMMVIFMVYKHSIFLLQFFLSIWLIYPHFSVNEIVCLTIKLTYHPIATFATRIDISEVYKDEQI